MNALRIPFLFILAAALLLAACAPAATPAPTATSLPAATATPLPSANIAQPGSGATPAAPDPITYKIVPGESKVTYEVGETFLNQNNRYNLAKGVTTQVTGEVYGDKDRPQAARIGVIQIDISQFKSDSGQRDNYIRNNGLQSGKYPIAKFVPSQIDALPASYQEGTQASLQVTGDLTIKETTRPVTWTVTTRLNGSTLTGQATTEILMSDFKVGPISILGVLNTEDKIKLTFDFVARP